MQLTRRLWAVLALAGLLAALAVGLGQPLFLAGATLVGVWVLATQYSFLSELERTARAMSITHSPARSVVRTNESTPVTFSATLDEPTSLSLGIDAGLPTAVTTTPTALHAVLPSGSTTAERTASVTWPIAGRHRFDSPRLLATDGLFAETLTVGDRPTVTVEPREPRSVHVGEGGEQLASTYGEHESTQRGSGIEPAEIREYTPGDTTSRIDWKATARLATPHVREHESHTNQRTLLVADHRTPLALGPPNETKLDYLRDTMLATAKNARTLNDPVGLLGVGDGGITTSLELRTTAESYVTVRRELLELEPGPSDNVGGAGGDSSGTDVRDGYPTREGPTLRTVRRSVNDLEHEPDQFTETLRPFYADRQPYRRRIRERPLFNAVRTVLEPTSEATWIAIFTDDSNPPELRETVSLARRNGASVAVFLAPTVLYEEHDSAGLDRARSRYVDFEEFRRELAGMNGVRAFEVGPGDRLSAILETGRTRGDRR